MLHKAEMKPWTTTQKQLWQEYSLIKSASCEPCAGFSGRRRTCCICLFVCFPADIVLHVPHQAAGDWMDAPVESFWAGHPHTGFASVLRKGQMQIFTSFCLFFFIVSFAASAQFLWYERVPSTSCHFSISKPQKKKKEDLTLVRLSTCKQHSVFEILWITVFQMTFYLDFLNISRYLSWNSEPLWALGRNQLINSHFLFLFSQATVTNWCRDTQDQQTSKNHFLTEAQTACKTSSFCCSKG